MTHAELIRELIQRWNAGDMERVLDLYAEDAVTHTGPHWPERASYYGRDEIRRNIEEWRSVWEVVEVDVDTVEEFDDRVVVTGSWKIRGGKSGAAGDMPIYLLFTVRDGKIAILEWFADHESAVAAARGS